MTDFKLINHIQTAVAVIDSNMTIVEENKSFTNRNHNGCSTTIGMKCFHAAYGFSQSCSDKKTGSCPAKRSFLTKERETAIHHYWIKGQAVVEEVTTTPVIEENGDVNYVIEEFRDITKLLGLKKGIIGICSYCRKIRNEDGSWVTLETYIQKHTGAHFSHGICEDCYSEASKNIQKEHSCSR